MILFGRVESFSSSGEFQLQYPPSESVQLSYPPSEILELHREGSEWQERPIYTFVACLRTIPSPSRTFLTTASTQWSSIDLRGFEILKCERILAVVHDQTHYGVVDVDRLKNKIEFLDWGGRASTGWGLESVHKIMMNAGLCTHASDICFYSPTKPIVAKWIIHCVDMRTFPEDTRSNACGPLACAELCRRYLGDKYNYSNSKSIRKQACEMLYCLLKSSRPYFTISGSLVNDYDDYQNCNCVSFLNDHGEFLEVLQHGRNPTCQIMHQTLSPRTTFAVLDCKKGCHCCTQCLARSFHSDKRLGLLCYCCMSPFDSFAVFYPGKAARRLTFRSQDGKDRQMNQAIRFLTNFGDGLSSCANDN